MTGAAARTPSPSPPPSAAAAFGLALLAVAGHWCALRLIDVKPYAAFQHYYSWTWLTSEAPPEAWVVLAQAVIVMFLAWRFRGIIRAWLAERRRLRLLVAVGLVGFSLAVPTETPARFLGELALSGAVTVISVLTLLFAVLMLPNATMDRLSSFASSRVSLRPGSAEPKSWDRWLPAVAAAWVTIAALVFSVFVFERLPHIDDSVSNYFQAKYLAAGRLSLPAPPDAAAFQQPQTVISNGKWFGYAFPIWPAALAAGVLMGAPWVVNPILGGLLVLAAHALVRRRHDRATANVAVLLLVLSPWLIFMSGEFMAHPLAALIATLACLAIDRATSRSERWIFWAIVGGLALGMLTITRVLDGAIVGTALAVSSAIDRRGRQGVRALGVTALVAAAVASTMLLYNQAVTGRATYPPHLAWSDSRWGPGVDRLGFGPDVGIRAWPNLDPLPGHGPADVVLNANKNAFMVNADLFGWAAGSLLLIAVAIALGGGWRRADSLPLALAAAYVVGYSNYWFSGGPDLGARYWYPLLVPLAMLSARGAFMMAEPPAPARAAPRAAIFVALASLSAGLVFIPWRATEKYYGYRGISGEVRQLQDQNGFGNSLVFIRSVEPTDYASAFVLNPGTLEDLGTIYAFDAGPASRSRVVSHYPNRPVWVIGRVAGAPGESKLAVIAGPLAPGTVPQ